MKFILQKSLYPADLPFDNNHTPRLIPWMIAFMIYLACLALAGSLSLNQVISNWDKMFKNGFTVELSPPESYSQESQVYEIQRQKQVLNVLHSLRGIQHTQIIAQTSLTSTSNSLIESSQNTQLPLPTLIDVEVKPGHTIPLKSLSDTLSRVVPGTVVKSNREWKDSIQSIADTLLSVSYVIATKTMENIQHLFLALDLIHL